MNLSRTLYILIILVIVSGNAYSQDSVKYTTEEIKVISNKIETGIYTSPAKIEVLKRDFILSKNGERLSDILQSAGGIFIKSYGNGSSLQTISINGLETEQTLVLLNGSKLNSYQNAQIDLSLISKDNIERIEIVNNGYSSLYGSEAIGGVVNIITTQSDGRLGLGVTGQTGSYGYRRISLNMNNSFGKLYLNAGVSNEESDDDFSYYFDEGKQKILKSRLNNSYSFRNVYADMKYALTGDQSLSYYTSFMEAKRNTPGTETGTAPSNTKQDDRDWNNIIVYENQMNDRFSIRSESNFQNNLMNYFDEPFINSYYKNIVLANRSELEYNSDIFSITGGYDLTYATINSNELVTDINRYQTGFFAASEIVITDKIKLFPSARLDNVSDIDQTNAAGKLGVIIKPFDDTELYIRGNIGNNYAAPTFNQLYWRTGGNPNLKTQRSFNVDAGFVYRFKFIFDITFDFNYTCIDFNDKIVWQPGPNGIWSPVNVDKTRSDVLAFDFKADKHITDELSMNLGVNYTYSQSVKKNGKYPGDPSVDKQLIYIPRELSKTNFGISYKDAGINLYYRFIGKRYTDFDNTRFLPAVDLLDGNIYYSYSIWKLKMQAKVEVNNILDTDYQIMPGYPMPLRNFK
ncbi:MAG TPA: TonB-dependent receptor, partial [Ignavibacteria bacterium]|nr:TonB-dependent receptor [Ignavibacteria bacterium]